MTMLVPIGYDAAIETWGPSWFGIWNRPYGHCQPSRKLAGKYEGFTYMSMHSWLVPDHVNPRGSSYHPVRLLGHPRDPSILCYRIRWPPKYYIPIGMMLQNAHQHQIPRLFLLAHPSMMSKMHISTIPRGYFSSMIYKHIVEYMQARFLIWFSLIQKANGYLDLTQLMLVLSLGCDATYKLCNVPLTGATIARVA